jgi:hypothetical protein
MKHGKIIVSEICSDDASKHLIIAFLALILPPTQGAGICGMGMSMR